MATVTRFEDLEIWKDARSLSKKIILLSKNTELKNDFRLRDQIKASIGSVMDNIAEGFERDGNLEFRQFLSIAKDRLERQGLNVIDCLTLITFHIKSLMLLSMIVNC